MYISKFVAPEIIFGMGSLNQVGECCLRLGASRVFFVADCGVIQYKWVEKTLPFLARCGLKYQVWSDFSSNPRDYEVEEGALLYNKTGCDAVVAFGGGSAIDAAKAVATLATNGGQIRDYEGIDLIQKPLPPLIVIPSTAGSGSEVSQFSIIADSQRKIKMTIISKSLVPDIDICDPLVLSTINSRVTAHTGMEALSHAVEAYLSPGGHGYHRLARPARHQVDCRQPARLGSQPGQRGGQGGHGHRQPSCRPGLLQRRLGPGPCHDPPGGGLLDLPIGEISAVLLPHVMRFNMIAALDKYAAIARAMGAKIDNLTPREAAEKAIDMVVELARDVGIPGA